MVFIIIYLSGYEDPAVHDGSFGPKSIIFDIAYWHQNKNELLLYDTVPDLLYV